MDIYSKEYINTTQKYYNKYIVENEPFMGPPPRIFVLKYSIRGSVPRATPSTLCTSRAFQSQNMN